MAASETSEPISPCVGALEPVEQQDAWRGEVAQRVNAYRARRRKAPRYAGQSQFSFEPSIETEQAVSVATAEAGEKVQDDFAFTLAIGRREPGPEQSGQMEIDVSIPAQSLALGPQTGKVAAERFGSYPVAPLEERRFAAAIDAICLLFAYGGFLALFSSLGGQFTISKLSAAVCASTIGIVYLQYFALFTIFGGTTPGMMFRGLQVTSFDGDPPQPRQMLLRSVGYILSAGTLFMGFLWACWDEDTLAWHDRLSRTYLSVAETFANDPTEVAPSHGR